MKQVKNFFLLIHTSTDNTSLINLKNCGSTTSSINISCNFLKRLKYLSPSLILTVGIIGLGEPIMTTTLGAKAGFTALCVNLLSCFFKVTVQLELGKHAIRSGETSLQAFNNFKGFRMLPYIFVILEYSHRLSQAWYTI